MSPATPPATPRATPPAKPQDRRLRMAALSGRKTTRVRLTPDAAEMRALKADLGLLALENMALEAEIIPEARGDFRLEGRLKARAVQPCIVTLEPVESRLDVAILRRYVRDWQEPTAEESEVPEDDAAEPLPDWLNLLDLAAEALALALPEFPRAPGAELGSLTVAPPGAAPLEETHKTPFAGLAGLVKPAPDDKA